MSLTLDRATLVLAEDQIGRTRYLTPEGFLYCEGVRIARVGPMLYRQDEVPDIEPSGAGMITIQRDADVLFAPQTIASFNGKPVTNGHPPDFVLPSTWRSYSVGTVLNPRQGDGIEADYLLADLLITDEQAIRDVQDGKREVSCGYDAPREQVRAGLGRQTAIIGNHVALVERGRAGPACAIQDGEPNMTIKRSAWDRLRTAFKAQDEAAFEEEMKEAQAVKDDDGPDSEHRLVIELAKPEPEKVEEPAKDEDGGGLDEIKALLANIVERLAKLEAGEVAETVDEGADGPEDKKDVTTDSAPLREAFAEVRARAEILSPGISLPTFDAKADRKSTAKAMHDLRIRALSAANADANRKGFVADAFGGRSVELGKLTADTAEIAFNAASALVKAANKPASVGAMAFPQGRMTPAAYADLIKQRNKRG